MKLTTPRPPQPELARPVCGAAYRGETCTLLAGHACQHRSSGGKDWKNG